MLNRTWAEIDTAALIHNFKLLKSAAGNSRMAVVVKANAYGHDVKIVAPVLQDNGADWFAVSNLDEAIELRDCGVVKPILILGYTPCDLASKLAKYDISQCVYSDEYAQKLSDSAVNANVTVKIHIKLDTGMSRLGFNCRDERLLGMADALSSARLPALSIEGVFTHFAAADTIPENDDGFTKKQYDLFCAAVDRFRCSGFENLIYHCCNSAGIIQHSDKHLDMCRAGIALYGLKPDVAMTPQQDFIPVMTVKSTVSLVKEIDVGDTVSYGRTFTAQKRMKLATVCAGYADGYPRLLSNRGYVIINGCRANIVGRICMDQFAVDVTDIPDVAMGDTVILFGKQLSVDEIAAACGTINYEIVCGVSPRVNRIEVKGQ